jgi:hypothetical protein
LKKSETDRKSDKMKKRRKNEREYTQMGKEGSLCHSLLSLALSASLLSFFFFLFLFLFLSLTIRTSSKGVWPSISTTCEGPEASESSKRTGRESSLLIAPEKKKKEGK